MFLAAAFSVSLSTTPSSAEGQEAAPPSPAVKQKPAAPSADSAEVVDGLESKIIGEWEYHYNDRLWRRRFQPDGTIELWLEGHRDGSWLSDLRWKREWVPGKKPAIGIFKGDEKIAVIKLKGGGGELGWQDLPKNGNFKMIRIAPENFWAKQPPHDP